MLNQENLEKQDFNEELIEIDIKEYIYILWNRKWLIIGLVIFAIIASFFLSQNMTKIYQTSTRIMVKKDQMLGSVLDEKTYLQDNKAATYTEMIKSRRILTKVIKELDLRDDKEGDLVNPERLINALNVNYTKETNMINIKVTYSDPVIARDIANKIVEELKSENQAINRVDLESASKFVNRQLAETKSNLMSLEEQLIKLKNGNDLIISEQYEKDLKGKITDLIEKKDSAELELNKYFSLLGEAGSSDQKNRLENKISKLQGQINNYREQINNYREDLIELSEKQMELDRLNRKIRITENIYQILMERNEENKIQKSKQSSDIIVIDPAVINGKPIKPNVKLNIVIAVFLAAFVGVAIIFVLEYLDTTVKNEEDIKKLTGLPVLGVIPKVDMKNYKVGQEEESDE